MRGVQEKNEMERERERERLIDAIAVLRSEENEDKNKLMYQLMKKRRN